LDDISPLKHAGEDWFATEEYARPDDIENPYTRGEVGREGEYYPPPAPPIKPKKKSKAIERYLEKYREQNQKSLLQRLIDEGKI
jgi:hypothetical protein